MSGGSAPGGPSDGGGPATDIDPQRWFDEVRVGADIGVLDAVVNPVQMFFFSAATYNGHRIHYDSRWATEVEGHPDLLVHGPLQSALLTRAVTNWMGARGRLVRIAMQNRTSAYPGEPLHFSGVVRELREDGDTGLVELELRVWKHEDELLMPGTATVRLPKRPVLA
jgi:acyl dehydratase